MYTVVNYIMAYYHKRMIDSEKNSWFFPIAPFGTKQGLNDTGVETFLDSPLESLVRETIQNSLDAAPPNSDKPVVVKFSFFDRKISDIPGIESLKHTYIPSAVKSWDKNSKEYEHLYKMKQSFDSESTVRVLRIADYNTTGLDARNWEALITETGVSSKSSDQSAGSKGIGKNAPFAASRYRMVVYNTKTVHYEKAIGVMVGVSYNETDSDGVSQARGYLGSSHNKPYEHQYSFLRDRSEVGTDVFVVGVKREYSERQDLITLNVLEHFMLSIYNGLLEVHIDEKVINTSSIESFVHNISLQDDSENSRLEQVRNYFHVLTSEETKKIYLSDSLLHSFPQFIKKREDAHFMLLATDASTATSRVLMSRKSGMRIKEQPFRTGVLFAGIFQAVGPHLNSFLRPLESAEHTDWTPERAEDYESQKQARAFLRELTSFLRENILALVENDSDDIVDAYGLAELLPDEDSQESKRENESAGSIISKLSDVTIKPARKIKQQLKYAPDESEIDGGSGGDGPGDDGRLKPRKNPPGPPRPNPEPPKGSPSPILIEVHDAKIRPIESDYRNGEYLLRVIPARSLANAQIKIAASGESGDYGVNIISATGSEIIGADAIRISSLPANTLTEIGVQINYGYRIRMKAVLYESK